VPDVAARLPNVLADSHAWGSLKMCIPEGMLQGDSGGHQQQPAPEKCLVTPMFPSKDASYHHPIGCLMRTLYQVSKGWWFG